MAGEGEVQEGPEEPVEPVELEGPVGPVGAEEVVDLEEVDLEALR